MNRRPTEKIELLAPAGSETALKAAINAGCDAVYIGGQSFGARAYAENPDTEGLIRCLDLCHKYGKKLYLTVNTLFKNEELFDRLYDHIKPLYEEGLDAVIVQDIGAMKYINDTFKDLSIHVSTQAAVMSALSANMLKEKIPNITRVVPARELSLEQIGSLIDNCGLETEIFVHGALCYCYSGQCLLSSVIGGRSGNRGRCAQPCRKLYNGRYLLSPKDLCALDNIYQLIDIGVDSLKIEGRMKSPEYVAGVVDVYRRQLDRYYELGRERYFKEAIDFDHNNEDKKNLMDLYNRGGFTKGYMHEYNGPDMMSLNRNNHSGVMVGKVVKTRGREAVISLTTDVEAQDVLEIRRDDAVKPIYEFTIKEASSKDEIISTITMKDKLAKTGDAVYRTRNSSLLKSINDRFIAQNRRISLFFRFSAHIGQPLELTATVLDRIPTVSKTLTGSLTEASQNRPTTVEQVLKQLSKLGDTDYILDSNEIDIDDNVFLPVSTLNTLRRDVITALDEELISSYRRNSDVTAANCPIFENAYSSDEYTEPRLSCSCYNSEQLKVILSSDKVQTVYYNIMSFDAEKAIYDVKETVGCGKGLFIGLPYVLRENLFNEAREFVRKFIAAYPDCGFLCRNLEEISIVSGHTCNIRTDYNVYRMNRLATNVGEYPYTLQIELNEEELKGVSGRDSELIVYGYMPVMFSAQCVYKNSTGKCGFEGKNNYKVTDITDELGHTFTAVSECGFCLNVIYNSACLDITGQKEQICRIAPGSIRYEFTFESAEQTAAVLEGNVPDEICGKKIFYTNGHFKRGIL